MNAAPAPLLPVFEEVRRVAGWLWARGWAEANAGNLSVDVTELAADLRGPAARIAWAPSEAYRDLCGRALLVSCAGARFRDMAEGLGSGVVVLRVGEEPDGCELLWQHGNERRPPTSELPTHLLIHATAALRARGDAVVLHTHPTHLIALNHGPFGADAQSVTRALWAVMPEIAVLVPEGVALAHYAVPGSEALAVATVDQLSAHRAVIWDKHGVLVAERDLVSAFDLIDVLDKAAGVVLACMAAGSVPRGLTDAELQHLRGVAGRL